MAETARELWVNRSDFRKTRAVEREMEPLSEGEVRMRVERFALTSNNVTYAVAGDTIGYWKFFPREDDWGVVPVWGIGVVEESRAEGIEAGERIYGYFPMADQCVMEVGRVKPGSFTEVSDGRSLLPPLYNNYRRLKAEPPGFEDERCLYFPLFITSFAIYDYLVDNTMFGAEQVVIGSVSSKTGLGVAKLLANDPDVGIEVIGLTSPGNVEFVESLKACDRVLAYGQENHIPQRPTAYIDMSGNAELGRTLHHQFGDNLALSSRVGATHWEDAALGGGGHGDLPGAKPEMFFAPSQILKREADWGAGQFVARASEASLTLARELDGLITVERVEGAEALAGLWRDFLDNKVSPKRGVMVSL